MQSLRSCFEELSNGQPTVPVKLFKEFFRKILPQVNDESMELFMRPFLTKGGEEVDHRQLLESVLCHLEEEREKQLQEAQEEVRSLKRSMSRHPLEFTVGQYNILAGYMGNNMEPWFLYGIDMPQERRQQVFKLHGERKPDGKPANAGWPNYVKGVLTPEEIQKVEEEHRKHFAWETRKDRLLEVIEDMDADVLSLVECDHYEDHFKPALEKMGYDSTWRKRPRPSSADGCCLAWRRGIFELIAEESVEFVDKMCPKEGKVYKDRIAVIALLRSRISKRRVCVASTHLQRNPEDPTQDMLRARQVGQVLRALVQFTGQYNAVDVPVVLTGDLNCTSFGRLRGVANTLSLMNREVVLHPFTFDCADVPTGVTSVTMARCMRIDAILYQSQRLELVDVQEIPDLTPHLPIPNAQQPSDHVPIVAQFRTRSQHHTMREVAKEWFLSLAGKEAQVPLNQHQLESAFKLYDYDGTGSISQPNLRKVLASLFGILPDRCETVCASCFANGSELTCQNFISMYLESVKAAGLPGLEDLRDAFDLFDSDKNGSLDLSELLYAFEQCAPSTVPSERIKEVFHIIDANGDGTIDLDEMVQYLAKSWTDGFHLAR